MVAIFSRAGWRWPRRWRRIPATAWRSAPPGSAPTAARPGPARDVPVPDGQIRAADRRSQPGPAGQLAGVREAADVADLCQHDQRGELARAAWNLSPGASCYRAELGEAGPYRADEDVARSGSALAGQSSGQGITGPSAYSLDHRGREEDQRSCHGTQAYRYQRGARPGLDIGSGQWRRRIETERSRHVMPPENLEIDGVPAEYPDDSADPAQPSHRQVPGS